MDSQITGMLYDRYEVHERLGRGGMGDVYKGLDTTLDRWVAIKSLHGHLADEEGFRTRFEREAKTIAALSHPNIVNVYDYGYDDARDLYFIVLEYLAGGTLDGRMMALRKAPLPERMAAVEEMLLPIIEAAGYAHQKDMLHRDIKPSNILFREEGTAVLADFGLARLVSSDKLTASGTTIGTPSYMSPEQGVGRAGDARSDIYTLGVIAYEMLAGMTPYQAETPFGVIMKHVNEPLTPLQERVPDIPAAVAQVVSRALAKQPRDRYQTATQFGENLQAAIAGETISTPLPTSVPSPLPAAEVPSTADQTTRVFPTQAIRQRPYLLWGAVGAAAVILIAAILLAGPLASANEGADSADAAPTATDNLPSMAGEDEGDVPSMAGSISVSDDFSDPESGWPIETDGEVTYEYMDGTYRFRNTLAGAGRLALFDTSYTYTSTYAAADATLVDGQAASGYGLVFRWVDSDHFYVFTINGLGQVSIWAFDAGAWRELRGSDEQWTAAEAVRAGESNRLAVSAQGDKLTAFVNDQPVIEVTDDSYDSGAVGFYVATTVASVDEPLAVVAFDNFVAEPEIPSMSAP